MTGLIPALLSLEAEAPLFRRGEVWIRAGQVRAAAARLSGRMAGNSGDVFVHTRSAAGLVAAILASATRGRRVLLPAHAQSAYLAEIGCAHAALLDDAVIALSADQEDAPQVFFDTALVQVQQKCIGRQVAEIAPDQSMRRPSSEKPAPPFSRGSLDGALGFFTSGSTSAPKLVETRLSCLEIQIAALDQLWGKQLGHVRGTVSHQHIYGLLFRVLWPLLSSRTADDEMALYWDELQSQLGPACTLISSPAHLTRLPPGEGPFADPPGLVFSSGQALPAEAAQACARAFGQAPIEVLGSTETGGIAWRRQDGTNTPWVPLPEVRVSAASDGALEVQAPGILAPGPQRTGDGVEMLADGRFHLRPRGDRIEKIDGKRVSLTRVEERLARLAQIEAIAVVTLPSRKHALAAIAVLTPEGEAQHAALGAFGLTRALRAACAGQLEPAERPKHWRFVPAMPTDAQGKRVLSTLRALFAPSDLLAPLDLQISHRGAHAAEIAFVLVPELCFFDGHFPQRPILPGIAQVHIAALLAQRLWQIELPSADLARVKFRHILQPNDAVRLLLVHDVTKQRLRFSFHLGAIEASLGEIG